MVRRFCIYWFLAIALALGACTSKPPSSPRPDQAGQPTHGQSTKPVESPKPGKPVEPPGWQFITVTAAEMRLVSVSPDGRSFFMTSNMIGDRENDVLVRLGETITLSKPTSQRFTVRTPATFRADIIDLPWGSIAVQAGSDRSNETGAVSPDLRYAGVPSAGGLWVGNLQTGEARIITAEPSERWIPEMGSRNPLKWAVDPHWSPDSRWIYVQSNRRNPYDMTWWRISINGGPEEPVEHELLTDDSRMVLDPYPGRPVQKRIQEDGFFFRSYSPDRRWAAADKTESPTFRLYHLQQPDNSVTYSYHPGRYAGTGYGSWSPDSSKVVFHVRPEHDLARFIGVLDLKAAGGQASFYAFPDPLAGLPTAVGFVGNDHLLVSMRPWNADYTDTQWPAQTQWWLLDLKAVPPVKPEEPTRLVSARLSGRPFWKQAGTVTGGETALAGAAPLSLRFDRPVSAAWLEANVLVEGPGAKLETLEAALGLATVRIEEGTPGTEVRIRVPKFGFDLLVRLTGPR